MKIKYGAESLPNLYDWTVMFASELSRIDEIVTLDSVRVTGFHHHRAMPMLHHPNLSQLQLEW